MSCYLAIDLGAGSGRAILGIIEDERLKLHEIHRFPNEQILFDNRLYWNVFSLFSEIKKSLRMASQKGYLLNGIAVDTWGVDFSIVNQKHTFLPPVAYRDQRTAGYPEKLHQLSPEKFYALTGIQQMNINTVYQLMSMKEEESVFLNEKSHLLFMPDFINYWMTGEMRNEYTIASTSQLLNAQSRVYDPLIFNKLGLPLSMMEEIAPPGTFLGMLNEELAAEAGSAVKVFAVGSHDTASAAGAIPDDANNWAFLSSGTWSLLGIPLPQPILTQQAHHLQFTNEGGVDGKILFLRNITGLWLMQRMVAEWEKMGENSSFEYLISEATQAKPFQWIMDPDDPSFVNPKSMIEAIRNYPNNGNKPEKQGDLVRAVLESLALKYSTVLNDLENCTSREIEKLYVLGGGSKNRILNQMIADIAKREVITGLPEATAIGNIVQQAIADETLSDWREGHALIARSFPMERYYPL